MIVFIDDFCSLLHYPNFLLLACPLHTYSSLLTKNYFVFLFKVDKKARLAEWMASHCHQTLSSTSSVISILLPY